MTDIGSGADISMESAFLYRAAAVVDKGLSVDRCRNSLGYDWLFIYLMLKKVGLV